MLVDLYVLRLTSVIHCMEMFAIGKAPQAILSLDGLDRGIKTVSFYMGQVQDALRLIEEECYSPPEISERSLLLAQTLDQLQPHLENKRLAIKFIHQQYNIMATKTQRVGTPKGMGAVLRAVKLTISRDKHNANGYRSVKCLEWNKTTETFIEQCLQCLQRLKTQEWQDVEDADVGSPMSATSATSDRLIDITDVGETRSASETSTSSGKTDIADLADDVREVQF